MRQLLPIILLFLIPACNEQSEPVSQSEPRFDCSSQDAYMESLREVHASLSQEDRERLENAMHFIFEEEAAAELAEMFSDSDEDDTENQKTEAATEKSMSGVPKTVDGMTASEVIQYVEEKRGY